MTILDQFESVFKAADKTPFSLESLHIGSVLVVTDASDVTSEVFTEAVQDFLPMLRDAHWTVVSGNRFASVDELLALVSAAKADVICTYRNLHTPAKDHPYSLGIHIDVLTQSSHVPVLLLPRPERMAEGLEAMTATNSVMAITDHMTGDHHLVSFAALLTRPGGILHLTHVEDEATFERYIATIAKIPTIDTESARETILAQLLRDPADYIESCRKVLAEAELPLTVESIVTVGHRLRDYQRLIAEHEVNLLVMNTKEEDQLAMHGLAYPLAVELRELPLLLL